VACLCWNATGARAFYCRPRTEIPSNKECFEKRGVRTPLPRSLSAAGFVSHSRRQLFANAAIAPKGTTSSSAEENFGFWIDEPTKIVTFADAKKLNVRRFDDHWISAVSGDVSYELDRQNGNLTFAGSTMKGGIATTIIGAGRCTAATAPAR
jgi:hypothetical protein